MNEIPSPSNEFGFPHRSMNVSTTFFSQTSLSAVVLVLFNLLKHMNEERQERAYSMAQKGKKSDALAMNHSLCYKTEMPWNGLVGCQFVWWNGVFQILPPSYSLGDKQITSCLLMTARHFHNTFPQVSVVRFSWWWAAAFSWQCARFRRNKDAPWGSSFREISAFDWT